MTAPKLPEGLEPVAWKCGNEFAPYHPSASHVNPDHRDGWNACYRDAQAALQAQAAEIAALRRDARQCEERRSAARQHRIQPGPTGSEGGKAMTKLHPALEALMPEPVKLVTACEDCCGTGHTGESQYMGEFQPPEYERCGSCDGSGKWIVDHHSPTQMRAAILAATERAAKKVEEVGPKEGALKLVTEGFAAAIRGAS